MLRGMCCSVHLFSTSRGRAAHGDTLNDERALRCRRWGLVVCFTIEGTGNDAFGISHTSTAASTVLGTGGGGGGGSRRGRADELRLCRLFNLPSAPLDLIFGTVFLSGLYVFFAVVSQLQRCRL
jgi:hypothetical protein